VQVTGTVVHRLTQPTSGGATSLIEYRHRDHLGSVNVMTDAAGNVPGAGPENTARLAFDPFGGRRNIAWTAELISPAGILMGLGVDHRARLYRPRAPRPHRVHPHERARVRPAHRPPRA
jgi:hypothetical protein